MPIYAIENTPAGIDAVENYDGEHDKISFLQAIILTRAIDGVTTTSDIYKFVTHEYPTNLADNAVSSAISKLEQLGLVRVYRDVTLDTKVTVNVLGIKTNTTLGDFVNRNVNTHSMPVTKMSDALKWHGRFEMTLKAPTDTGVVQVVLTLR